ncbi:MAG: hypothetical protein [Caudoviricetes sp.]|nr:MAG: hypothetical protein [Caudoviricetes sp.]
MSREHAPLHLYRQPISGDWQAVRVAKDGSTITDKYPIDNIRQILEHELSNAEITKQIRIDMQKSPAFRQMDGKRLEDGILYALMDAVEKITE